MLPCGAAQPGLHIFLSVDSQWGSWIPLRAFHYHYCSLCQSHQPGPKNTIPQMWDGILWAGRFSAFRRGINSGLRSFSPQLREYTFFKYSFIDSHCKNPTCISNNDVFNMSKTESADELRDLNSRPKLCLCDREKCSVKLYCSLKYNKINTATLPQLNLSILKAATGSRAVKMKDSLLLCPKKT